MSVSGKGSVEAISNRKDGLLNSGHSRVRSCSLIFSSRKDNRWHKKQWRHIFVDVCKLVSIADSCANVLVFLLKDFVRTKVKYVRKFCKVCTLWNTIKSKAHKSSPLTARKAVGNRREHKKQKQQHNSVAKSMFPISWVLYAQNFV